MTSLDNRRLQHTLAGALRGPGVGRPDMDPAELLAWVTAQVRDLVEREAMRQVVLMSRLMAADAAYLSIDRDGTPAGVEVRAVLSIDPDTGHALARGGAAQDVWPYRNRLERALRYWDWSHLPSWCTVDSETRTTRVNLAVLHELSTHGPTLSFGEAPWIATSPDGSEVTDRGAHVIVTDSFTKGAPDGRAVVSITGRGLSVLLNGRQIGKPAVIGEVF